MQIFNIGDHVSVLHEVVTGKVVGIEGTIIIIEDEYGFTQPYERSKLVLRLQTKDYRIEETVYIKEEVIDSPKKTVKKNAIKPTEDRFEIDLHIEELIDSHTHLSNFEIIQIQLTACRAFVQDSLAVNRKRIVLIHGRGEGVLKSEIHQYLDRLFNRGIFLEYHDASYQRYGRDGATEVLLGR